MNEMIRIVLLFCFFSFKSYSQHTRYIDFQIAGINTGENYSIENENRGIVWGSSNVLIDFNFTEKLAIATNTTFSNRIAGFHLHAMRHLVNTTSEFSSFYEDTFLASQVFAFAIRNNKTQFLVGKIRPSVSVGSSISPYLFNDEWRGAYGTFMNGAYANSNKIGAQLSSQLDLTPNSKQVFEVAFFKNDTTSTDNTIPSKKQTFGHSIPIELRNPLGGKRVAGTTSMPASFSLLFVNKLYKDYSNSNVLTSVFFRHQAVDTYAFQKNIADENSYFIAQQYEKSVDNMVVGFFGEYGIINNAYGLQKRNEKFHTASVYTSFDSFILALVHNKYNASGANDLNIENTSMIQTQFSLGYKFSKALRVDVGFRKIQDKITNKSANGSGIVVFYNFGTKGQKNASNYGMI